jgi:hypothetical protein
VAKLASLMDYYYETMYPELKMLEEHRLKILSKLKKIALVLSVLFLGLNWIATQSALMEATHAFAASAMGGVMLFLFFYRYEKKGYDSLFKDNVIEKVIAFIDPTLHYQKEAFISESEYRYSRLLPQSYDRFQGSDLVQGERDGVALRFSSLHVEEKRQTKDNKDEWHTLFQGLFFVADFHKHFKGRTYIFPDVAERSLGGIGTWLQGLHREHGTLIKLDHTEFEKQFVVYGDDTVEAHYILNHAFMERIVSFYEKERKNLFIGFVDGKMYLAMEYTQALFEPKLTQSVLAFAHMKSYFERLEMVFGIVEAFKLNQTLWSKYT